MALDQIRREGSEIRDLHQDSPERTCVRIGKERIVGGQKLFVALFRHRDGNNAVASRELSFGYLAPVRLFGDNYDCKNAEDDSGNGEKIGRMGGSTG